MRLAADDTAEKVVEKKRRILRAAAEEFRARGFHATGMRDIAARLGMTVGNLYYYFKNKDDLLAFCQEDTLSRLEASGRAVEGGEVSPDRRLFELIAEHVVVLNEGTPGSLAHLEVPAGSSEPAQAAVRRRDRYERRLRDVIKAGVETGVFEPVDPKTAALAILGAVNWTVRWFRDDGKKSAREVGESFARQLVRGLLADGRKSTIDHIQTVKVPRRGE